MSLVTDYIKTIFSNIKRHSVSLLLFSVTLFLYSWTAPPTIYPGDGPLLTTATALWGTAHPPGYPLFSFLGAIWSHVILPFGDFGWRMHMFSAFWGSLAVVVSYLIIQKITKNMVASVIGALSLTVSYVFWEYSIIAEVFSMHIFISLSVLYFLIRFYLDTHKRDLYFAALFFSFGIAHHHTIVLWVPGFAILVLLARFWKMLRLKDYLYLAMIIVSGFLWYAYIPFSYYLSGQYYWGDPSSLQGVIDIFFRKMYGTFDLTAGGSTLTLWDRFFHVNILQLLIRYSYGTLGVILGLMGAVRLLKKDIGIASALLINFIISGPLFLVFAGTAFEGLLRLAIEQKVSTLSLSLVAITIGVGISWFCVFIQSDLVRSKLRREIHLGIYYISVLTLFTFPLLLLINHWDTLNLREYREAEYLATDVLKMLPATSVFDPRSDVFSFTTRYMYAVEHFPPNTVFSIGSPIEPTFSLLERYAHENGDYKRVIVSKEDVVSFVKDYYNKLPTVIYGGVTPPDGSALAPLGVTAQIYEPQDVPSLKSIRDQLYWFVRSSRFIPAALSDDAVPPHAKQARNEFAYGLLSDARFFHINRLYKDAMFFYELALDLNPDLEEAKLSLSLLTAKDGQCQKALLYIDQLALADLEEDTEAARVSVDVLDTCRPEDVRLELLRSVIQ